MPNRVPISLYQTTYNKKHMKSASSQKLTNCYMEPIPNFTGKPGMALRSTPGCTEFLNLTGNTVRNLLSFQNNAYAVVDNRVVQIVKVGNTYVTNDIGTISSSRGRLSVSPSLQGGIVWCDGERAYLYDNGTVSDITNTLQLGVIPTWTIYKDGFTLYLSEVNNLVFSSDYLQPSVVNSLNQFQVLSSGNPLISANVSDQYIYFFGQTGTELWYTSGATFVPFDRVDGGIMQVGIAAAHSSAVINNNVYWLCQSTNGLQGIAVSNGPSYQIISTADFVAKVGKYNSISDAFAYVDTYEGHTFYNICFPNAEYIAPNITRGRTWAIDIQTGCMFERQSINPNINEQDRHITNCHMYFDGKQISGDWKSGKLYEMDLEYSTENGRIISCSCIGPHIWDRDLFFSITNIEIGVERGEAPDGDAFNESNPEIALRFSKDYGNTWGRTLYRNIGKRGQYKHRIRFGSVGGGRSMTPELFWSGKLIITSATAEYMTNAAETPRS